MKPIKKLSGVITGITELSPTAREITIKPSEPVNFNAGSFMNVFIKKDTETLRRAFSLSSSESDGTAISFTIRLDPRGAVTPLFWQPDIMGTSVELMGPLGHNTAEKMQKDKIFLFGFGVGAGVVKSLATHFVKKRGIQSLVIMTGSRTVDEVLYKEYFDGLATQYQNVTIGYVLSAPTDSVDYKQGYIQDHLEAFNFNHSNVYVCGQEVACNALVEIIRQTQPKDCTYLIEGFH